MARIRTLKPDAFSSESLCAVPRGARWTFAGLLTYVDDEGRGRADPRLIRAAIYPLDDDLSADDVDAELDMLEKIDTIRRYEVDGKRYLYFPNWDHQKISHPTPSRLPAPSEGAPPTPPEELRNPPEGSGDSLEASSSRAGARSTSTSTSTSLPSSISLSTSETRARENDQAPAPESNRAAVLSSVTDELVAEYATAQPHTLPRKIRADLYREVDALLGEGIHRDVVREGLVRLSKRKDARPGLLPHLVHDVLRGQPAAGTQRRQANLAALDAARERLHGGDGWPLDSDEPDRPDLRIIDGELARGVGA